MHTPYGIGDLLTETTNNQVIQIYQDGQGSTRAIADNQVAVQQFFSFDAFGNQVKSFGQTPTEQTTNHLYVGEYFNSNTGLYHLRARDYDPKIGRFISRDSFEGIRSNPLTLNPYLYVSANPINKIDPTGKFGLGGLMTGIDIQTNLAMIQIDFGLNLFEGIMDPDSVLSGKNAAISLGILALGGTGVKLMKMLSGKFRSMISKIKYVDIAPRKLTTAEVGLDKIPGVIFDATYQVKDHVAIIRVDMISVKHNDQKIPNPLKIMNNFADLAKKDGAVMLRVEGTLANDRLLNILQKKYNMVTHGANDSFTIDLINKI